MTTPARNLEIGRGFVRARECPDCFHTRCGEDCVCNCDAAHAEDEAAHLRSQVESLQSLTTWHPITEPPSAEVHAWCGGRYLLQHDDDDGCEELAVLIRGHEDIVAFLRHMAWVRGWLPIPPSAGESEEG